VSSADGRVKFSVDDADRIATISSDITPCSNEDVIDKYISPELPRNHVYMPLDDAYTAIRVKEADNRIDGETKYSYSTKYVRDTITNLLKYNINPNVDL
jgi:hypothetical protein